MKLISFLLVIGSLLSMPVVADSSKTHTIEEVKADFQQLFVDLESSSYDLYAKTPKATFEHYFAEWSNTIEEPMTTLQAQKLFMRFTALANIAHTAIEFPIEALRDDLASGGKMVPLAIEIRLGRIFVSDYYGPDERVAMADEIMTIDGIPAYTWLERLQVYVAADNTYLRDSLVAQQFAPLVWLLDPYQSTYELTMKSSSTGENYELSLKTLSYEAHTNGLATTSEPPSAPRTFKLIGSIGYLKPGPFYNIEPNAKDAWSNASFAAFIDEAFHYFRDQQVTDILIDLRDNPGGSSTFSDLMIAWFADQPFQFASSFIIKASEHSRQANAERLALSDQANGVSQQLDAFYQRTAMGTQANFPMEVIAPNPRDKSIAHLPIRVHALVDKTSFSNAVVVAAIIQDYQFGVVLGEETADLATTYASMEHFSLQNTGIRVGYPKALIVRPNGDQRLLGVRPDVNVNGLEAAIHWISQQ